MKKHHVRGALIFLPATIALLTLMFLPRMLSFGIAVGIFLILLIIVGVLDFFGSIRIFRDKEIAKGDPPVPAPLPDEQSTWMALLTGFHLPLFYTGLALLVAAASRFSVQGTLGAGSPYSGPLLVGLGIAILVAARWFRRPFNGDLHTGFLVFVMATATIMTTLGSHGLWDCWETHYGEVARRQLEQDDWISLFWENNWFFSKPILIFWMMNLGMAIFGVRIEPDMISDHAEWGVRFLVGLLAILVLVGVHRLIAKRISSRAGIFVALVLGTMPLFGFMARQAITDLPFVGFMTLAVVCFLYGITAGSEDQVGELRVPVGRGRFLPLTGFHLVIAGYLAVGFPQFLYLATRSSEFKFGTLARNDLKIVAAAEQFTHFKLSDLVNSLFGIKLGGATDISLDWFLLGILFLVPFCFIIYSLRHERRVSRLAFHGMYLMLSLSVMAKGLAGLVMPLLGLIGYWLVIAPYGMLRRPLDFLSWHLTRARNIDLLRGIPMFFLVAAPWYVAMIVRHSEAFINRFFIHDHIKRLSVGVHGDTGTFQYFVKQLGYAAFPWVALLPCALLAWPSMGVLTGKIEGGSPAEMAERKIRLFVMCWTLFTFGLLGMMVTKFHHYVFPLIPCTAILVGLFIDDIWKNRQARVGIAVLLAVVLTLVVARDLVAEPDRPRGVLKGFAQLVGLFIYKYSRPYPDGEAYDFSLSLGVFAAIFVLAFVTWLSKKRRKGAIVLTLLVALGFSHFLNQHYMIQLAPHWTQKHLIEEYYRERKTPAERLVAFQMNWKGENFYTGNRVLVYVSTKNKQFEDWVEKHRGERHFFITEQSRFLRMSSRAKAKSGPLQPLSDTCNKYKIGMADEL